MFQNQLSVKSYLNNKNHVTLLALNGVAAHGATAAKRQYSNRTLTTDLLTVFLIFIQPGRWGSIKTQIHKFFKAAGSRLAFYIVLQAAGAAQV